jgi:hypothetical protein
MSWHVIAVALAVLAVLGVLGLPRAICRRWLSGLRAWLGDAKSDDQRAARWKRTIGVIGLLAIAVLLLSLMLPWFRVVVILLAVLAVVAMLGVLSSDELAALARRLGRDVGSGCVA